MLEWSVVPGGQLDPWQLVLVRGADAPIDCMPLLLYMTAEPLGYLAGPAIFSGLLKKFRKLSECDPRRKTRVSRRKLRLCLTMFPKDL